MANRKGKVEGEPMVRQTPGGDTKVYARFPGAAHVELRFDPKGAVRRTGEPLTHPASLHTSVQIAESRAIPVWDPSAEQSATQAAPVTPDADTNRIKLDEAELGQIAERVLATMPKANQPTKEDIDAMVNKAAEKISRDEAARAAQQPQRVVEHITDRVVEKRPDNPARLLGGFGTTLAALALVVALNRGTVPIVNWNTQTNGDNQNPTALESATPGTSAAAGQSPDSLASMATSAEQIKAGSVTFIGIPQSVDSSTVDTAKGAFKNTIGLGTEMAFAEPGGLLVGPDFGFSGKGNPLGDNPKGWVAMYDSKGNIQPISPVTQEVLHYEGPAYQNVPEGGWMIMSTAQAHVKINNYEVDLPYVADNNYLFVVRGMYGDMQQNTDKNSTAVITNYAPGHALVMNLESGTQANIGFLSQGQLAQMAETSHSGGTNLGDGGASRLTLVIFDENTGAMAVLQQDETRNQNGSKNWVLVSKNW
jgi:hypothetical protein